jgi:hypothetical protein
LRSTNGTTYNIEGDGKMPQAIVDPDELRRFAVFLNSMAESVRNKKTAVSSNFSSLKEVWRDQKYTQFERVFTETTKQLDKFLKDAANYAQYLQKKASIVDKYLERGY